MTFDGAVIREQGVTFALVVVKSHIVQNRSEAGEAISAFQPYFPGMPVVLVGQDSRGVPTYFGRPDIARFMASVPMSAVPWKTYTV
jgi:hypothetical protein